MVLTFQIPMQYCSLQRQILLSPADTSAAEHCFHSEVPSHLILSGAIGNCLLLFPSNILDISRSCGLIFGCDIFLPFPTVHEVLQAIILEWVAISFPSGSHLLELFNKTCPSWVGLYSLAYSSIELCKPLHHDKVVIHEGG